MADDPNHEEIVADLLAQIAKLEKTVQRLRSKHYDGCAWCCASTPPDRRGEGHSICRAP